MEVTSESSELLNHRSYYTNNRPKQALDKRSSTGGKTFGHFQYTWNTKQNTNFANGGFLAGLHWSPLISCLSFQDT